MGRDIFSAPWEPPYGELPLGIPVEAARFDEVISDARRAELGSPAVALATDVFGHFTDHQPRTRDQL